MRLYLWPGFPVGIFPQKIAGLGHLWFGLMIPEVFPCQLPVGVLNHNFSMINGLVIGLREKLQESPIFNRKIHGFL